ncbi:MAG: hypothetical protein JXQ87_12020 [Bacteroidia bacterium]
MKALQVLFFLFSSFCLAQGQTTDAITFKKQNKDDLRQIEINKGVKIKTKSEKKYNGKLVEITDQYWLVDEDTVLISSVDWVRQKTVWRPIGTVLASGGTTLFIFGTVGWASSVGSEDTWAQLGAFIGALLAFTGATIDGISIPMLIKGRKYRIQSSSKWQLIQS